MYDYSIISIFTIRLRNDWLFCSIKWSLEATFERLSIDETLFYEKFNWFEKNELGVKIQYQDSK